jgi:hypothetical protein
MEVYEASQLSQFNKRELLELLKEGDIITDLHLGEKTGISGSFIDSPYGFIGVDETKVFIDKSSGSQIEIPKSYNVEITKLWESHVAIKSKNGGFTPIRAGYLSFIIGRVKD